METFISYARPELKLRTPLEQLMAALPAYLRTVSALPNGGFRICDLAADCPLTILASAIEDPPAAFELNSCFRLRQPKINLIKALQYRFRPANFSR